MDLNNADRGPFMRTISGRRIYILEPKPLDYGEIRDIAHHLSLIYRYNGGTRVPWSVAEHSIMMSYVVPQEYALEALLHDAHEMAVGDNITPMKRACPELKAIDALHERAMRKQWGLTETISDVVKVADGRMHATETRQLRPMCDFTGAGDIMSEPYTHIILKSSDWESVKKSFLRRFYELTAR